MDKMIIEVKGEESGQKGLKPRQKRFATKTKTGCFTCRERRVKCDEGKPYCLRCINAKKRCGGYPFEVRTGSDGRVSIMAPATISSILTSTSEINGSADAVDLMYLVPMIAQHLRKDTPDADWAEFMLFHSQRMGPYLAELPRRTGHDATLDSAIKVAAASLRWRFANQTSTEEPEESILAQYSDTLRKLQVALHDPKSSKSPDTLCTTVLLSLFETLRNKKQNAYMQHASAASALIQHRGPQGFTTDYEKNLLISQIALIMGHAYLRGTHMFLEDDAWQSVMESCITDTTDLSDRDRRIMSFGMISVCFPGLMREVAEFCQQLIYDDAAHEALLRRVEKHRNRLQHWSSRFGRYLFTPIYGDGSALEIIQEGEERQPGKVVDVFCSYEGYLLIANRLHVALGGELSTLLEIQSREVASDYIGSDTGDQPVAHGVHCNGAQSAAVIMCKLTATSILNSTHEWTEFAQEQEDKGPCCRQCRMVSADMLLRWLQSVGFAVQESTPSPSSTES